MSPPGLKDPYRYYRDEAKELCEAMARAAVELEAVPLPPGAVAGILRPAHTLKGASRVVGLPAIAEIAHELEEILAPIRIEGALVPRGLSRSVLGLLDRIASELKAVALPAGPSNRPAEALKPLSGTKLASAAKPPWESVRLEVSELDEVMTGQRAASVHLAKLRRSALGLADARRLALKLLEPGAGDEKDWAEAALQLGDWLLRFERLSLLTLDQAELELDLAHARTSRMRLTPASELMEFLEGACRDAAQALGKQVQFSTSGGERRLDAPVLRGLQDALQHVVRNAVVHGIEPADERIKMGKPAAGNVKVELAVANGRAVIRCSDDGRGLDHAAIVRQARAKGLISGQAEPSLEQSYELLLLGGLSTSAKVTELAGRGLGLEVLRETVERLHGVVTVRGQAGQGLTLVVDVPVALSAYQVLEVAASGTTALIPFSSVRSVQRMDGATVAADGKALPLLVLDNCFNASRRQPRVAVVLQGEGGLAALALDQVLGQFEAVILPLPALAGHSELALGACLDAAGDPRLVLDPEALMQAARQRDRPSEHAAPTAALPVLVIDDSLTTRMLEQSILETAGYTVDLAISAEEGLEYLRKRPYGLILVDVEMPPGMSGFELLELLKDEKELCSIPAILVSSCSSLEDKRRGAAAGARDYIVKGVFDQVKLLARIGELIL